MVTASQFRDIAMALPGTQEKPHFDRRAFRVHRIFATLAADGLSANLKLSLDEQLLKCEVAPALFEALDNGWGRQGWTLLRLPLANAEDIDAALRLAHAHATTKRPRK